MQTIEGFDFFSLTFDDGGALTSRSEFEAMVQHARTAPATDAIFIAHGFRNDAADASRVYTNFLKTFRGHLSRQEFHGVAGRRFVVAGVYLAIQVVPRNVRGRGAEPAGLHDEALAMEGVKRQLEDLKQRDASPSQRPKLEKAIALLPQLDANPAAQDEFVTLVFSLLDNAAADPTEGLEKIRAQSGSDLLAQLGGPTAAAGGVRTSGVWRRRVASSTALPAPWERF